MAYAHQDWETVVLKKKPQQEKHVHVQREAEHTRNLKNFEEVTVPKKYESSFINKVVEQRIALKMTQRDLANRLKVQENMIKKFEQGHEVYNSQFVDKVNRLLFTNKGIGAHIESKPKMTKTTK